MPQDKKIKELEEMILKLQSQINELSGSFYKNNFTSTQNFNKDAVFNSRLRVPVFSAAPSVAEIGDLIAIGGKLYICTVPNTTFTLVGSQTP